MCPEYYEYVKFNTIFANDFMSITDKNMQLLPQVSRLIFSLLWNIYINETLIIK